MTDISLKTSKMIYANGNSSKILKILPLQNTDENVYISLYYELSTNHPMSKNADGAELKQYKKSDIKILVLIIILYFP